MPATGELLPDLKEISFIFLKNLLYFIMVKYKTILLLVLFLTLSAGCEKNINLPEKSSKTNKEAGSHAISYTGQTDQDLLIWLIKDRGVIKKLSFRYYKSETLIDGSDRYSDSLVTLVNNEFSYVDQNSWSISGKLESGKFTGEWHTLYPLKSGTWSAEQSTSMIADHDSLTMKVGHEKMVIVECGVYPYQVIHESNADIATVTGHTLMTENGMILIEASEPGYATITIGDASYKQLSVVLHIVVE